MGLKGLSSEESGLPSREELEGWWVEGMNETIEWQQRRAGTEGKTWSSPIYGMGWVSIAWK